MPPKKKTQPLAEDAGFSGRLGEPEGQLANPPRPTNTLPEDGLSGDMSTRRTSLRSTLR